MKKSLPQICQQLEDPINKQDIRFCYKGTAEGLLELMAQIDGEVDQDLGEFETGLVHDNRPDENKAPTFWIWIKRFRGTIEDYAFLVHETTHLLQKLLKWLETPLSDDTTELCAAWHEHIFGQILTILRNQPNKSKKPRHNLPTL